MGNHHRRYKLIVSDLLSDEFDPEDVKQQITQHIAVEPALVESLFGGEAVVLEMNLSHGEARKRQAFLSEIGVACQLETHLSLKVDDQHLACPVCGYAQDEDYEQDGVCGDCGVQRDEYSTYSTQQQQVVSHEVRERLREEEHRMLRVNVDSAEEGAREGLDKSLSWQQSLAVGIGVALFTIVVLKQLSQTENSSAQQESSEEIAVVTGDTALIDAVDKKLAESLSLFKQHHQDKAVALTEDVLALAKTTENQDRQGELLQRIAVTQADQDALVLVKLTIKELFRLSDHIYTRIAMAKSYIRQQALPEARLEAKAAWQAFQQLAVADKTAALLADLLMVRVDLGAEGVKGFVALDSLADKSLQSQALLMVAEQLHAIQKRPDKMMSMLEGAFVTAAKVDDPFYRMTLMTAALVKRAELDKPEGIAVLLSRIPAATQKSRIWLAMAKSYRRSGKEKTAQQAFQKALTLASPGQRVIIEKVLNP